MCYRLKHVLKMYVLKIIFWWVWGCRKIETKHSSMLLMVAKKIGLLKKLNLDVVKNWNFFVQKPLKSQVLCYAISEAISIKKQNHEFKSFRQYTKWKAQKKRGGGILINIYWNQPIVYPFLLLQYWWQSRWKPKSFFTGRPYQDFAGRGDHR